jgi:hypothetical protein
VARPSFASLKQQFALACVPLRAFTLGQRGATQRGGIAAAERVSGVCDRLTRLFPCGPHAVQAAALVVSGRRRVAAAAARLAVLRGKQFAGVPT